MCECEVEVKRRNPLVSIIIPALNEEHTIATVLRSLARQDRISDCEVIVVDGRSSDATVQVAENFPFVQVEVSEQGRVAQMNRGAQVATAPVVWFLHVDSTLPDRRTVDSLLLAVQSPDVVGGCFSYHLRGDDLYYRLVNTLVNLRARAFDRPYGDQGLFVRRDVFSRVGGFRENVHHCEDLDLVLRLRAAGKFQVLSLRVETSARTWKRYGNVATTLWHLNQWVRYEWSRRREFEDSPRRAPEPGGPAAASCKGVEEIAPATAPEA